jgi:phosphoserine phosphatase
MAYIEVDIEDHLDEVHVTVLIEEVAKRFRRAKAGKNEELLTKLRKQMADEFSFLPEKVISENILEQSKRELIEEFIEKISYEKLKEVLDKCI